MLVLDDGEPRSGWPDEMMREESDFPNLAELHQSPPALQPRANHPSTSKQDLSHCDLRSPKVIGNDGVRARNRHDGDDTPAPLTSERVRRGQ